MALVLKDRVRVTSSTTGTGTFTLGSAASGFQDFSVIGDGNTTYYTIQNSGDNTWEVGIGTYTASGTTLSRDTVLESSNSGSLVNFAAGTKDVFVTYPAEKGLYLDASNNAIGLGTPASATLTNATGLPISTGVSGLGSGVATFLGTPSSSNLASAVTDETGSGSLVFATSPTLVTPALGTPSSGTLTSCTGLPLSTGVTGTLPVTNGGTGTATSFTTGSVVFAGASGVYSQDNANLFWDDTNNRLGIGTTSPSYPLSVGNSTTPTNVTLISTLFSTDTASGLNVGIRKSNDGTNAAGLAFMKSRGTNASPTAVQSGDSTALLQFNAYGGTNYRPVATIASIVDTYTSDTNISGYLTFNTNGGSTNPTERMRITSAGNVGIGTTSPASLLAVNGVGTFGSLSSKIRIGLNGDSISSDGDFYIQTSTANFISLRTNFTERMRIDSSGNVGIGCTPNASLTPRLEIASTFSAATASTPYNGLLVESTDAQAADKGGVISLGGLYDASSGVTRFAAIAGLKENGTSENYAGYLAFYSRANGSVPAERMRITSGGEVYIAGTTDQGAYNLQCNGTGVWGAGAYVNGSDERIKQDITTIDTGLDVVNKLNPVTYKYKEDWSKDQSIQTGFIAQDLLVALEGKNYVDGIVQQGGEYMSVAYQNIIPLLTKAIQELSAKVTSLEAQLQGK